MHLPIHMDLSFLKEWLFNTSTWPLSWKRVCVMSFLYGNYWWVSATLTFCVVATWVEIFIAARHAKACKFCHLTLNKLPPTDLKRTFQNLLTFFICMLVCYAPPWALLKLCTGSRLLGLRTLRWAMHTLLISHGVSHNFLPIPTGAAIHRLLEKCWEIRHEGLVLFKLLEFGGICFLC